MVADLGSSGKIQSTLIASAKAMTQIAFHVRNV